jgi:hypothetical protein
MDEIVTNLEPFATVADLEKRWHPLTPLDQERATVLLEDASIRLVELCRQAGIDVSESGDRFLALARTVVCDMVKRVMAAPVDMPALTSLQTGAGPYQEMQSFANPSGDMYLTAAEKKLLGIGPRMRIGTIRPQIGGNNDPG